MCILFSLFHVCQSLRGKPSAAGATNWLFPSEFYRFIVSWSRAGSANTKPRPIAQTMVCTLCLCLCTVLGKQSDFLSLAGRLTFAMYKKQGARRYSWELNRYMKKNRHISPFKSTATAGINSPSIQFHVQREKGEVMIVSELGNWQHSIISCAYTWLPITDKHQGKTSNDFVWQKFVTSSN